MICQLLALKTPLQHQLFVPQSVAAKVSDTTMLKKVQMLVTKNALV
jgi:hypothetical protein